MRGDTEDFKEREARAMKLANEIEKKVPCDIAPSNLHDNDTYFALRVDTHWMMLAQKKSCKNVIRCSL